MQLLLVLHQIRSWYRIRVLDISPKTMLLWCLRSKLTWRSPTSNIRLSQCRIIIRNIPQWEIRTKSLQDEICLTIILRLMRTRASEDQWMVATWCDEWLTMWCELTLGRVLQVQVVAWLELVQVKSGRKGLCLAGPPRSGEISRLVSRDSMASGVKCGHHGGKKSKMKSWTRAGVG
jgi:hypothetical protein